MKSLYALLAENTVIETERLRLRPVRLEDAEEMYQYASDEDNLRYSFEVNRSIDETKAIIAQIYLASPLGRYGIEEKSSGHFIGTLDLHHVNLSLKKGEVGYCLNKAYWNKGYATEALSAFIKLVFETLQMNCLITKCDQENIASSRVMAKSGMRFSHLEPYAKYDKKQTDRIVTVVHYVLTKEDYFTPQSD